MSGWRKCPYYPLLESLENLRWSGGGGVGAGLRQKFARGVQFLESMVNVKPVKACFDVYLQVLVLK